MPHMNAGNRGTAASVSRHLTIAVGGYPLSSPVTKVLMNDLVKRLRGCIGPLMYQHDNGICLTNEAADEIERLTQLLIDCCEDDSEGPHIFGKDLWDRLEEFWPATVLREKK